MDEYPHIVELISMWEEQARQASRADAMLLNKQIRQLREALYTVMPAKHVLVPVERGAIYVCPTCHGVGSVTQQVHAAMLAARPEVP